MAKTYTAPTTIAVGDALTASLYNTYVGTNVANLIVPPTCRVQISSNQTFSNASWAALSWATSSWDTDSMFTAATNYIQINTAGLYQLSFCLTFAANAAGDRIAYATLNNATIDGTGGVLGASGKGISTTDNRMCSSTVLNLAANDRIRLVGYQNSGGNLNTAAVGTENFLSVVWVGRTS